ncbi:MAG: response regulator transcription factor [Chloroflexota bacterium]
MPAEKTIRVLVIDDSEAMQLGLSQVLTAFPDFEWVGESRDGQDTLQQCERLHPDVVLLDVGLRHIDVVQMIHLIRERFPHIQVIAITSFEAQSEIDTILNAGAVTSLPKNANVPQIVDTLRQVVHAALPNLHTSPLVNRTGKSPIS